MIDGEQRLSFAEWERLAQRAALGLLALGVAPGDVVAYQLPNWWEAAVMFLAAARIGAVVNPVLPLFRARELSFILRQSGASVLIIPGHFRGCDYPQLIGGCAPTCRRCARWWCVARRRAAALSSTRSWPRRGTRAADGRSRRHSVAADALLMLMYTSGTTADPKGVLHTHDTLIAEVQSLERMHALTPRDRTLMPSPLTHISGVIHAILTPALLGTSAVLMERWDAGEGLELIGARTSHVHGRRADVPAGSGRASVAAADAISPPSVSSRAAARRSRPISSGAPALDARAASPSASTARRSSRPSRPPTRRTPPRWAARPKAGAIAPGELRIVDPTTARYVPSGADGEIQARGPECFVGYADAALNAEAFTADGWFRTGDLGRIDAAGYLRVTGRLEGHRHPQGREVQHRRA